MKTTHLWIGIACGALLIGCADKQQLALVQGTQARRLAAAGDHERAAAAYEEAIALYAGEPSLHLELARARLALGQLDLARQSLEQVVRLSPADAEVRVLLSRVRGSLGDYPAALAAADSAATLAPGPDAAAAGALAQLGIDGLLAAAVPPEATGRDLIAHLDAVPADAVLSEAASERLRQAVAAAPAGTTSPFGRLLARQHLRQAATRRAAGDFVGALDAYRAALDVAPDALVDDGREQTVYGYDSEGRVALRATASGDTTRYAHDALGRLVGITTTDGASTQFEYDPAGDLTGIADATGETSWRYDDSHRPVRVSFPNGRTIRREYADEGRTVRTRFGRQDSLTRRYDDDGRLIALEDGTGVTRFAYDDLGNLVERQLPNGITTRYGYDAAGRPTSTEHRGAQEVLFSFQYVLDGAGRPLRETRVAAGDTTRIEHRYDPVGRRVETIRDGETTRVEYDAAGNRLRRTSPDECQVTYAYGRGHRLRLAGDTWYDYDAAGNLTARVTATGETRLRYDDDGRLVEIQADDGSARLTYRGDGHLWSIDVDGSVVELLTGVGGQPVGRVTDGTLLPFLVAGDVLRSGRHFLLYDRPGGDPVALCDSAGTLSPAMAATFAAAVGPRGAQPLPGGLLLLDGRPYDPQLDRFLTPTTEMSVSTLRFDSPYAGPDPAFGIQRDDALAGAVPWAGGDPFDVAVGQALRGRYAPPVRATPSAPRALGEQDVLRDPRLEAMLPAAAVSLWGEQLLSPAQDRVRVHLPHQETGVAGGSLRDVVANLTVAELQTRWRWAPGNAQASMAGAAGITHSAGGLLSPMAAQQARDVGVLDGFGELYAVDLVPADSAFADTYAELVEGAARGAVGTDELAGFLDTTPVGPWTPQIQLLFARQLLRDGRVDEAEAVLASMEATVDDGWGDEILMAWILVREERRDPQAVRDTYERLRGEYPDSPWLDDALYVVGRTHQAAGDNAAALGVFADLGGFPESVWTDRTLQTRPVTEYFRQITRLTSVSFDPGSRQLVFAGENDPSLPPIEMDDFVVTLRALYRLRQDPAVSIGTEASGQQDYKKVRFDGGTARSGFGMTMYEADYLLKTLAVGIDSTGTPVVLPLPGYKSVVEWTAELDALVLGMTWNSRVWFVPGEVRIRRTPDGNGILIDEIPIVVLSETKFHHRKVSQQGAEAFAEYLTENFDYLATEYEPVRRLPQLASLVAVGKWMRDEAIPVDIDWVDSYEITDVATPELVKAGSVTIEKSTKGEVFDSVRLRMEGGVSFREPNKYEIIHLRATEGGGEDLDSRPAAGESSTWVYETEDGQQRRAVSLAMGTQRRDGRFAMSATDLDGAGPSSARLERYYDSFENAAGPLGQGWRLLPYELRFQRQVTGKRGETGDVEPGTPATLLDRVNGGSLGYEVQSRYAMAPGLTQAVDGSFALTQRAGAQLDFDTHGRLTAIVQRDGRRVRYVHRDGRLTVIEDDLGGRIGLTYNVDGHLEGATDERGRSVAYTYDERGNLFEVRGPGDRVAAYRYDSGRRLVGGGPDTPTAFRVAYDAVGRVQAYRDRVGQTTAYSYDVNTGRTTIVGADGVTRTREFDADLKMRRQVDALAAGHEMAYTRDGDVASITSSSGDAVRLRRNRTGEVVEISGPSGYRYELKYGDHGLALLDQPGGTGLAFEYDDEGNLTGLKGGATTKSGAGDVSLAVANATSFAYDDLGRLQSVADEKGKHFEFERGAAGQITAIRGPKGAAARVHLDESSRIERISGHAGADVAVSYSDDDRLSELTGPTGTARLEHTDDGRLASFTGPEGGETRFEYEDGRLMAVHFGDGSTVRYLYDDVGRLTGLIDPLGQRTMFERDAAGHVAGVER